VVKIGAELPKLSLK